MAAAARLGLRLLRGGPAVRRTVRAVQTATAPPPAGPPLDMAALDYAMPAAAVAARPPAERGASRLLVAERGPGGRLFASEFARLPGYLPPGSLLVLNDSRVIAARLAVAKAGTGGAAEVLLLHPAGGRDPAAALAARGDAGGEWECLVRGRRIGPGAELELEGAPGAPGLRLRARVLAKDGRDARVALRWAPAARPLAWVLERAGRVPLPPYLGREADAADRAAYQTVYARASGSVAAPTAGLHFSEALLGRAAAAGVEVERVTLHVGAGTFAPVEAADARDHRMHWERFAVPAALVGKLARRKAAASPVTAVGTTSVRTLESLYWLGVRAALGGGAADGDGGAGGAFGPEPFVGQWEPHELARRAGGWDTLPPPAAALDALARWAAERGAGEVAGHTQLMIAPGYRYRVVDNLVTNFHLPKSTLLLLVAAFLGGENGGVDRTLHAYETALAHGFRFLSYGDASLLVDPQHLRHGEGLVEVG